MGNIFLGISYTKCREETIPFLSNFALYSKGLHFRITRFAILILCTILHLEKTFEHLY